jgi:hypothetical protein
LAASINGTDGIGSAWEVLHQSGLRHIVGSVELQYDDAVRLFAEQQNGAQLTYSGRLHSADGASRDETLGIVVTGVGSPDENGNVLVSFALLEPTTPLGSQQSHRS